MQIIGNRLVFQFPLRRCICVQHLTSETSLPSVFKTALRCSTNNVSKAHLFTDCSSRQQRPCDDDFLLMGSGCCYTDCSQLVFPYASLHQCIYVEDSEETCDIVFMIFLIGLCDVDKKKPILILITVLTQTDMLYSYKCILCEFETYFQRKPIRPFTKSCSMSLEQTYGKIHNIYILYVYVSNQIPKKQHATCIFFGHRVLILF